MRDRFPLLVIGGLVLLGVLGSSLFKGAARGSFADKLSSYRSEPDGARGVYLLAQESGIQVERLQKSLVVLGDRRNLALLAVEFDGTVFDEDDEDDDEDQQAKSLIRRLDAGTLFDDDDEDQDALDDPERQLHRGLNRLKVAQVTKDEREELLEHVKKGATVLYVPWYHPEDPFLEALDVGLYPADAKLEIRTLVPTQPTPYTLAVERVEARVQSYLDLPEDAVPLLVDEGLDGEVVAALVPYGQGRVIVIGAPELAMNKALRRADNAQLWVSMLKAVSAGAPVGFDEFHHGFTSDRSIAEFAKRYGLHFAAAQLLLGVGLWAAALRRFGRPRPPPEDVRVGATDSLVAASRLYREGKHCAYAAHLIARGAAQDLAPAAGVQPKATAAEVAAALASRGRQDVSVALLELTRDASLAASDADVQHVARAAALARSLVHKKRRLSPLQKSLQTPPPHRKNS
ncbi:MAG: DUF4350 domain-containing protein [Myxococcaceae bacterium]